jgi:hypothetical protein
MRHLVTAIVALVAASCQPDEAAGPVLVDQQGFLEVAVCSRGCYQYILSMSNQDSHERWFPVNLDKEVQQAALDYAMTNQSATDNRLPVSFSGMLLKDSTTVTTPGADDVPVPAFKARNIELKAIKKR